MIPKGHQISCRDIKFMPGHQNSCRGVESNSSSFLFVFVLRVGAANDAFVRVLIKTCYRHPLSLGNPTL